MGLDNRVEPVGEKRLVKVGDLVILNSGGPEMTVTKVEDGVVTCDWDLEREGRQQHRFTMQSLKIVTKPEMEAADV